MALTKAQQAVLYAIAQTASNVIDEGAVVDVSTFLQIDVRIRLGRATSSAFTVGPKVRLEGTYDSTSPDAGQWVTLAEFQAAIGASLASQAVSGTEAAGQTTITLAAGTNFAAGDYVFFHNGTLANSEWARVESVSGADIVISEGLVNAQTGATCRDQAEQYRAVIDVSALQGVRLVVDGAGSGQAVIVAAEYGALVSL
jgi:hypothetical protein